MVLPDDGASSWYQEEHLAGRFSQVRRSFRLQRALLPITVYKGLCADQVMSKKNASLSLPLSDCVSHLLPSYVKCCNYRRFPVGRFTVQTV